MGVKEGVGRVWGQNEAVEGESMRQQLGLQTF